MDVVMIQWPADAAVREHLAVAGEARLLLVGEGQRAPTLVDCLEDWIRVPADDEDLRARVDALSVRSRSHDARMPTLDADGVLRHQGTWVSLPRLEGRLIAGLLERFGAVVGRDSLIRAAWPDGSPGRNALDVQILRLRRRIAPVGLVVRTVRSRGYLLEQAQPASAPANANGAGTGIGSTDGNGAEGPAGPLAGEQAPATVVYARLA